ncbi:DUF2167 domain-containing protein [Robertkochia solimangrovi]|uniref:DUF2167 domain-containing protein n=1 Tax=Robertkochia solimangrovi TaxID=2213046 RepID=UPI00117E827B|nr:DUF2167 domain-containing protein [Robertkochia solimangrovi]TRZ43714.1 DUF2167 domain-containing protein [Robertkochia solimangrovi]
MTKSLLLCFTALSFSAFSQESSDTLNIDTEAFFQARIDSIENSFHYQHGTIEIGEGLATITVPEGFKFLDAEQSQIVLTDLWGNPPAETYGLLFPEDMSPIHENFTYAVEITYSEDGYIDDTDARELDYDELLAEMKEDMKSTNPARVAEGYPEIELIGWASAPYYDSMNKKLHWAKELHFGGEDENTLNYEIRVLGRKGYLNLNAIGNMPALPIIQNDTETILSSVNFNEGYRYSDFNPDLDEVAAYGIGGLIAGKVLAKAGFFAVILKFWKVIALGVAGGFGILRKKIFGSKDNKESA